MRARGLATSITSYVFIANNNHCYSTGVVVRLLAQRGHRRALRRNRGRYGHRHAGTGVFSSAKQDFGSAAPASAETAAASEACRAILFLRGLLEFMTNKFETPTPLKIDATVAIAIANREGLTNKSRHMQIKHLLIQECVIDNDMRVHKSNRGNVVTQKVDTTAQLADPLTKPLGKILHKQYLDILAPKLITRA